MSLRKILEELASNIRKGFDTEPTLSLAHQQILALIPKRKDDTCFCDSMKVCNCDIKERESFNACISEITHNLTKEE